VAPRDQERIERIQKAIAAADLDALLCTLPSNVLMLSGYWPVVGSAIGLATREGAIAVIAPEDEQNFARKGRADIIQTFPSGSLESLQTIPEAVLPPLSKAAKALKLPSKPRIGFEGKASYDPSGYAAKFVYGAGIHEILNAAFPEAQILDATGTLDRLRAVLTPSELGYVRRACEIARRGFLAATSRIRAGMPESELASFLQRRVTSGESDGRGASGFAYCMSGLRSALAYAAYQQSSARTIQAGDLVLLHCNSNYNGFWTDITRTYSVGPPNDLAARIRRAVMEARSAALEAVRPGVKASAVDRAARDVLTKRGFGAQFKHPTGHGVGFAAINHNASPKIHPKCDEPLEAGMVFNVEPGVYIDGVGGIRQCDMVAVTGRGAEVLTPFQESEDELIVDLTTSLESTPPGR
jgi:Xaa-Pro aminopeptidase